MSAALQISGPWLSRYVDYLLEAVSKRELFGLLRLEPDKWWHSLLFRDRYNMLGILAVIPPALQESLSQHPGALTQVDSLTLAMPCWLPDLAKGALLRAWHFSSPAQSQLHTSRAVEG